MNRRSRGAETGSTGNVPTELKSNRKVPDRALKSWVPNHPAAAITRRWRIFIVKPGFRKQTTALGFENRLAFFDPVAAFIPAILR
jgi:hypothetical protein